MKKPIKVISLILGLLIVLPLVVVAIALVVIDPNEYKPEIESLVQKQTGREFNIEGNLGLSVFPWIGVELGKMTLGNAKDFGPQPFAQIEKVEVKVHLLPLLRKEIEVSAVTLNGLELNLAKNKAGITNWDDLTQPSDSATETTPAPETTDQSESKMAIEAFTLGGLKLNNATFNWHDETTNTRQSIQGMNLTTGAITMGKPIDIELTFALAANQPPVEAQIRFSANIAPDLDNQKHQVNNAKLHVTFNAKEPAASGEITLTTSVSADMEQQFIELPQLHIETQLNDQASGMRALASLTSRITFNLASEQLALTGLQLNAQAQGGDLPKEGVKLTSATDIKIDLKKQTLAIDTLALTLVEQIKATVSLHGTQILDKPSFLGNLTIASFNPRQLLQTLGQSTPETQDPQALQSADLSLKIDAKPDQAKLSDIVVHLDKTTVKSQLALSEFDAAMPKIKFNVNVDRINIDNYLPPPTKEEVPAPTQTPDASQQASEPVPLDPLRELNLDGQIDIGHLTASNLKVSDIAVTIKAKDGLINIHPLKAKLYDGHYAGNIQLNAKGEKLVTSVNEQLTGIQAGPLLKDLIDNDMLDGKGDVKLKLTTSGLEVNEIMQSLAGNVAVIFKDGAVSGFNIAKIIRETRARLQGDKLSPDEEVAKTDFAELSASLDLKDGVARNQDLHMKSPLLRVTGKGDVYYIEQRVDYVANITIVGTSKGQGGKELDELKGLPLDIKIKGPFTDPKIDVDLAAALKAKAKAKAKEKIEEVKAQQKEKVEAAKEELKGKAQEEKEQAQEKLKDEVKDRLKKLF